MALKYAVLEILSDRPHHGYAVRTALTERLGAFWPISQGQVYATLQRLERDGLAHSTEDGPDRSGAGRKSYTISNRGHRALDAWRSHPYAERPNDGLGFDDWIAHLAVAHRFEEPDLLRRTLDVQRRRCEALLDALRQREDASGKGDTAMRVARGLLSAELGWLEIVERELLPDTSSPAPPA